MLLHQTRNVRFTANRLGGISVGNREATDIALAVGFDIDVALLISRANMSASSSPCCLYLLASSEELLLSLMSGAKLATRETS